MIYVPKYHYNIYQGRICSTFCLFMSKLFRSLNIDISSLLIKRGGEARRGEACSDLNVDTLDCYL